MDRSENTQAVVAERPRVYRSQPLALEVGLAAIRIHILLSQRIPGDGVDGEVAAPSRFLDRQVRVPGDLESSMAAARLGFPPRQGDVDRPDLEDREGFADHVYAVDALE